MTTWTKFLCVACRGESFGLTYEPAVLPVKPRFFGLIPGEPGSPERMVTTCLTCFRRAEHPVGSIRKAESYSQSLECSTSGELGE